MDYPPEDNLLKWLNIHSFHLKTETLLEKELQKEHDLSLKEFYVLYFLSKAPRHKLKLQDLQEQVGLSQSAISRLVSKFEAKGCGALQRHICEEDRRAIYTSLTAIGEQKLQLAMETVDSVLSTSFDKNKFLLLLEHTSQ